MKWHNAIWTVALGILLGVTGLMLPLSFQTVAIAGEASDEYISPKQITPPSLKNTIENEVRFNNEIRENESGETEIVPKIERFPPKAAAEQLKRTAENLQERLSSEESLPENAKRLKRELRREEPPETEQMQEEV